MHSDSQAKPPPLASPPSSERLDLHKESVQATAQSVVTKERNGRRGISVRRDCSLPRINRQPWTDGRIVSAPTRCCRTRIQRIEPDRPRCFAADARRPRIPRAAAHAGAARADHRRTARDCRLRIVDGRWPAKASTQLEPVGIARHPGSFCEGHVTLTLRSSRSGRSCLGVDARGGRAGPSTSATLELVIATHTAPRLLRVREQEPGTNTSPLLPRTKRSSAYRGSD